MTLYRGMLEGMLTKEAYENLKNRVSGDMWHSIECTDDGFVQNKLSGDEVRNLMGECLRDVQKKNLVSTDHPYTYAKNPEDPLFIKIYDPMKCGSSCSVTSPRPWYVLSKKEPAEGDLDEIFPPKKKKLFGMIG